MRLLQGSWSEVLTLSLIFRTLPTTVAAASASAKESEAGLRRRLKFAPDFALTEAMALQIDLEEFYNHVSFTFHFIVRGKNAEKSAILGNASTQIWILGKRENALAYFLLHIFFSKPTVLFGKFEPVAL